MAGPFDHLPTTDASSSPFAHLPGEGDVEAAAETGVQGPVASSQEAAFNRSLNQKPGGYQGEQNALATARQRQAQLDAQGPVQNAWNAFKQGTSNLAIKGVAQLANALPGQKLNPQQMTNVMQKIETGTQEAAPNDPTRLSGKVGATAAQVAPMLLAPEAAPEIMLAQGTLGRQEEIDTRRASGQNITPQQAMQYQALGGAMDFGMGKLAPGGAVNKSLMGELPAVTNPLLNAGKNALIQGAVAAPEMGLFQAGQNVAANVSGVAPERQLQEGVPEASATGLALGGAGGLVHGNARPEAKPSEPAAPAPDPEQVRIAELERRLNEVSRVPRETQAAAKVPEPDFTSAQFETQGEAHPETAAKLEGFNRNVPDRRSGNAPVDQAAERRFEELTKQASFQSPEEANPRVKPEDQLSKDKLAIAQLNQRLNEVSRTPKEIGPAAEKPAEPDFATARFEPQAEAHPETSAKLEGFTPVERRVTETPVDLEAERRFEKLTKQATFETPDAAQSPGSSNIKYAEQKAGLLPDEHTQVEAPNLFKRLASEEAGGLAGGKEFVEKDVVPAIKDAAHGLGAAWEGLRDTFGFQHGPGAEKAKGELKRMGSDLAQKTDQLNDQFNKTERALNKLPVADQRALTHAAETGGKQPTPELQSIADAIRGVYDDRLAEIQKRDPTFQGVDEYMAHAWKDPAKAATVMDQLLQKRPLAGKGEFRKARSIMTQEEGIARGLEPVSNNPITQMKARVYQMDKWIGAHDVREHLESQGLVQPEPANGKPQPGWSKVNDPSFRKVVLPDAVASTLRNVLEPGITGHPQFGPAVRGLRTAANVMNQVSLIGPFHAAFSTATSAIREFGRGMAQAIPEKLGGEGQPLEGVGRMALGATGVGPAIRDLFKGSTFQKEWLKPGSTTPEMAAIVEAAKNQGGRAFTDSSYKTNMTDKMMQAFRDGNPWGGVARAPFAAVEQIARPIMEALVPKLKAGSFVNDAQVALRDNPNMSAADLSKKMGDSWRSIDNQFGQMVEDNRFWKATTRQLAHLSFRSVGWNWGSLDEAMSAGVDSLKYAKNLPSGQAKITSPMQFAVALPTLVGLWGAAIGYGLTRKAPQSIQDLMAPKTGEKDAEGNDIRVQLPTYMKDVLGAQHDLGRTVTGKLHPWLGATLDVMANKDFSGTEVYDSDEKGFDKFKDIATHYGKAMEPISLQQWLDKEHPHAGAMGSVGVSAAPKWMGQSEAEQEAHRLIGRATEKTAGRPAEAADLNKQESVWANRLRGGESEDRVQEEMAKSPNMSEARQKSVFARAREAQGLPGLIHDSRLQTGDLQKIWSKATPAEQATLKDGMQERLERMGEHLEGMSEVDQAKWKTLYKSVTGEEP